MSLDLNSSVQYLKGVGPKTAQQLGKLGISSLRDVLHFYPRTWQDRRTFGKLHQAIVGEHGTFKGTIAAVQFSSTRRGISVASVLIQDGVSELVCKWLKRPSPRYDVFESFRKEMEIGKTIIVHGRVQWDYQGRSLFVDEYELLSGNQEDHLHVGRIVPIYPLSGTLRARFVRNLVHQTLTQVQAQDFLPTEILTQKNLPPLHQTLMQYHFPETFQQLELARTRLAFSELFSVQTVLALLRLQRRVTKNFKYTLNKNLLTPFRQNCAFDFTDAQKKVIREIFEDMTSSYPMNRLLQGDVGSGKTVVALCAMLLAAENNAQSLLMAPTEILAEQHVISLRKFLKDLPVRVELLTGTTKGKQRKALLQDCAEGKVQIVVGTHALLDPKLQFPKCGLIVIDEQHRFGVGHRLELMQNKNATDILVMSATPIPRTLAMGFYGDLEVSSITQLPKGRKKILTLWKSENEAYKKIEEQIQQGRQAFIVYPLVDESDKIELKSAVQESEKIKNIIFPQFKSALLHGKMKPAEKDTIMRAFRAGEYDILIATTVIEVGIDVPNASVILIHHAERFGLSTLHQLRGRVGRGQHESFCILCGNPTTEDGRARIQIMLRSSDGFELAEEDLKLRGIGTLFGSMQHGLSDLRVCDLTRDRDLIFQAQEQARALVERDPSLTQPSNKLLRQHIIHQYQPKWHWAKAS